MAALREDMSSSRKLPSLDEPVSDEWRLVAQKLPRESLIEDLLELAEMKPDATAAGAPEVDLDALARRAKVRIKYSFLPTLRERKHKGPTILIPATYPKWDERFAIARGLAKTAVSTVSGEGSKQWGMTRDLERLVRNPLPIHLDAIASAILMPKGTFTE